MARSEIPVETGVFNTVDALTGDTVDTTNYHVINSTDTQGLFVLFDHTGGTDGTAVFVAGDNPPAFEAGLGNLSVTITAGALNAIPILSSRFAQDDGTIQINVGGGDINGTAVYAIKAPRGS